MSDSEETGRIDRLEVEFHRLRELGTEEREVRLDELAAESPRLAEQVAALLDAHDRPAFVDDSPLDDPRPGERIGSYVLESLIGRGGMGSVWRARQLAPDREVALKLLRPGRLHASARRRLAREADIMGAFQHPAIASVFEAGEIVRAGTPTPFFAMELINGLPLDQFITRSEPSRRERLELFVDICDAISHAHARGVVHRDLKPANILVTAEGRPKVLDFGIARATTTESAAETLITSDGQIIGTLAYMSPEQTGQETEIDARADVYSLGVILFELISGKRPLPLSGRPLIDAVEIIRGLEAPPLSRFEPSASGDLTVIAARCLAKEPGRRYRSVVELSDDIRRHLDDRPILARPAGPLERGAKFIRRHRVGALAVTLVLISLTTGLLVALDGKREAERAATESERLERQAQRSADEARAALRRYKGLFGFFDETLAAIDSTVSGRYFITLESFVDEIATGLAHRFPDDDEARVALQLTVGQAYSGVERFDDSRRNLQMALDHRLATCRPDDPLLAECYIRLAGNEAKARAMKKARDYIGKAQEVLAAAQGGHGELRTRCHVLAAYIHFVTGDYVESRKQIALARSASSAANWNAAWIEAKIAIVEGRYDEGIRAMDRAIAAAAGSFGDDHPMVAELMMEGAECELNAGRLQEAEERARTALARLETRLGSPFAVVFRNHGTLGRILMAAGRLKEAETFLRSLMKRHEELDSPESYTTSTRLTLGSVRLDQGRLEEAAKLINESTEILEKIHADGHHILASALQLSAQAAMARREVPHARELARRSWEMACDHPAGDIDLNSGTFYARIVRAYSEFDEAIDVMEEVVRRATERHGDGSTTTLNHRALLGAFQFDAGHFEDAVETLEIADALAAAADDGAPDIAFAALLGRLRLGAGLVELGRDEEAVRHLEDALDRIERQQPPRPDLLREVHRLLFDVYDELEDEEKSEALRRRTQRSTRR